MLDPVTTPLLALVLGKLAQDVIGGACRDFLKDKLKGLFSKASKLGTKDDLQLAYEGAMQQAYETCCEVLLRNIETFGVRRSELPQFQESLEAFIKDPDVAAELFRSIKDPNDQTAPSPQVLQDCWQALDGRKLPSDQLWLVTTLAYRNQALQQSFLSDPLRKILLGRDVDGLLKEVVRQGGVKTQVRRDKYSQRMWTKFSPVDLANLMPAYAEEPGRMVIRDVFVAQNVRENPPPVEIPKDLRERLQGKKDVRYASAYPDRDKRHPEAYPTDLDDQRLEKLRTAYVSQSPKPVLDVITAAGNRLLVLTGEPGSGKSTLMRYLLTGIIEPPVDPQSGLPLPWTLAFEDAFPVLIELRDFYALRQRDECDSFLEYVAYMGKTDQWFLDDHAVHAELENGPSLVMFDGLDEIFDPGDRQRVMQEIAGFAQRYPGARIIVTSRPVDYKEQVLRGAGFAHFGIQDLGDGQIETFVRGWFALTFPQQPQEPQQRIERVLGSVRQSKPIRLLAGNPMLLTIMALLAREQELPRDRGKFYEKAMEVFCHHWDGNKGLDLPDLGWLNVDDKLELLRRIALRMQTSPGGLAGNVMYEDNLEDEIKQWFIDRFSLPEHEAIKAARTMIKQLRERNYILCLRGSRLYGFLHRTFLEYLTAAEYVRRFDKQPQQITIDELIELFDNHCRDDDWREVLRLICGQIDEQFVGRIVEHLATRTDLEKWEAKSPLPEMALAVWCLAEARNMNRLASITEELLNSIVGSACKLQGIARWAYLHLLLAPALKELTSRWPKIETVAQKLIVRDSGSEAIAIRNGLIVSLTASRDAMISLAASGSPSVRSAALQALAEKWPDESTRKLLAERAVQDEDALPRSAALDALAETWPDESTRKLLAERAVQDENEFPRSGALWALAERWPDETTRKLLAERAVQDEDALPRSAALDALAETWPDETTRKLLAERAIQDEDEEVRSAALQVLAENWPDETTRKLLAERAVQDEHEEVRFAALEALAEKWPDETTRKLLAERAVQDENEYVRRAALRALAEKWPDESTRKLLAERAGVDGFAASLLGGQHSEFGRIVLSRHLDGRWPYLDPAKPLSRQHIERAAERANVPAEKIDDTVQSLSEHLGWDITQGAGA